MTTSLYMSPTRLERAYANYLLQTCFSGKFPISGRNAVSFLTQSNLPRSILREIWNIVDPIQDGKLVQPEQWWTLLKLVALAQQQSPHFTDASILLQLDLGTITPLPVFENVIIPMESILLQQYSVGSMDSMDVMLLDVSGSGRGAPTHNPECNNGVTITFQMSEAIRQQQPQQQQQQKQDVWNAPVDFNVPKQTTSLSAALDELGGTEDMPLPSLVASTTDVQQAEENNTEEDDDDFGDFTDAPVMTTTSPDAVREDTQENGNKTADTSQAPAEFSTLPQTTSLEAALEELGPIHNAPLPPLCTTIAVVMEQRGENDEDDEFGDFEAPEVPASGVFEEATTSDPLGGFNRNETPAIVPLSSALDELGSSHDLPLPSLDKSAPVAGLPPADENDEDDEFGDFEAPEVPAIGVIEEATTSDPFGGFNRNETPAIVPLSSALDELGSSHDLPLPSLDSSAPVAGPPPTDENDEDDEFGDFETPEVPAIGVIEEATTSDPFGGFNRNETPAIVPLSSALDELGSSLDLPLPSLDSSAPVAGPPPTDENDEDDEFGDFETPEVPAIGVIEEATTSDPFGGFNTNTTQAIVPLSSALDELGSSRDLPLPSLDNSAPVVGSPPADENDEDDEFGDFESPNVPASGVIEEASTSDPFGGFNRSATPAIVPLSSALDELGSSHDLPLPSLDISAPVAGPQSADENDEDDEFGDFEAPEVPASGVFEEATTSDPLGGFNRNETPAIVPLSSALDELGSSHDLPSPSLDNSAPVAGPPPADENDEDDEFGDFEAPEVAVPLPHASTAMISSNDDEFQGFRKENESPAIVPLSLALDELGPIMDAPLPALGAAVVGEWNQIEDEDQSDEFGNFVAPPAQSIEASGKFEVDLHNQPLKQDETDAFTNFKETVAAPVVPLSSALDELGSSHDAPLPSLETFAVVSEQKSLDEEDVFGDFEDAPNNKSEEEIETEAKSEGNLISDALSPTLPSTDEKTDEFVEFEAPKEVTSLSSALDSLGAIQDAPLPPLGVSRLVQDDDDVDDDDDDEFGDFEEPVGVQEADGNLLSSAQDAPDSADNAPFPPLNVSEQQPQECDMSKALEASLVPLSSALDSLGPTQDAPLSSLGSAELLPRQESDNQDDCGNFNDVPNDVESSDDPLKSLFAGCGPAEDMALPTLESFARKADPTVSDIEADVFGSFKAPHNQKEIGINEAQNEKGAQEAASEQSNCDVSSEHNDVDPSQDEALPPADSHLPDSLSDIGNDVMDAAKEVKDASGATINNDDRFYSAFDAIAPVENSPLPSFGMHKVTHENSPKDEHDNLQENDFGSFEGPPATETEGSDKTAEATNEDAEAPTISEASGSAGSTSDPFASAFDTLGPVEDAPLPAFGSGEIPREDAAVHVTSTEVEQYQCGYDEDGFGSFEDATETEDVYGQDTATRATKEGSSAEDLFSNSVAPIDEPVPTFHSASGSDFSGFETASENITSEEKKCEVEMLDRGIDDFGDFSGASPAGTGTQESNKAVPSDPTNSGDDDDDDDDFGDFTAIEAPVDTVCAFDAEWGDFEEPSAVQTSEDILPEELPTTTIATKEPIQPEFAANFGSVIPESEVDDEFGDFGSFQEVDHPGFEKEETLEDIATRVHEMQKSLTIRDSQGGEVDVMKMFQENIQVNKPASGWRLGFNKYAQASIDPAESMKRGERCCQVMMLLTTDNKSSLNHWERIFDVVRDELAMGSFLLEEAKSIAGEKAVCSALEMWVAGLGEYVRVTRSIASTLCDLLCLDIDVDGLQMKNIMALLDSAIEVEDLWATVYGASKELNLALPKLETISDIRIKCLQRFSSENLCHLTLQPLSDEDKGTTKNSVEWSGRHFLACAANFWSNRVSTDVPV